MYRTSTDQISCLNLALNGISSFGRGAGGGFFSMP
jgi:hypothetical protein